MPSILLCECVFYKMRGIMFLNVGSTFKMDTD